MKHRSHHVAAVAYIKCSPGNASGVGLSRDHCLERRVNEISNYERCIIPMIGITALYATIPGPVQCLV